MGVKNKDLSPREVLEIPGLPGVLKLFGEGVKTNPEKVAIEYGRKVITYGDLDKKSSMIAQTILESGWGEGVKVAFWIEDRIELVSAILGVMKVGGIFIPFDPTYPIQRLVHMFNEVGFELILTDIKNNDIIRKVLFDQPLQAEVFYLPNIMENSNELANFDREKETYGVDDSLYIYFTSGSTGKPKGILGSYQGLSHFINWEIKTFGITSNYRVSQLITPTFDAFLRDVFVPLCVGGTLCIPENRDLILNGEKLINWLEESRVNLVHCVPSIFKLFNSPDLQPDQFSELQYVLMSGERINPEILKNWYHIFGERIHLVNLYGPSETTMVKTYYLIQPADAEKTAISIGTPMAGAEILIVDENLTPCKTGEVGELLIRTPYMTHGYYNDPLLTAKQFITNPLTNDPLDRVYKTGDLGRWLSDGQLEFLGRRDHQVKIRGNRVEPGEIENHLLSFTGVQEAVVIDREDRYGNTYLCAYIVAKQDISVTEMRAYLGKRLPDYMIPSYYLQLEKFPLLSNGKIDRKALPLVTDGDNGIEYVPPCSEVEIKLAGIWSEVLGVQQVGLKHNFFEIGGHSLNGGILATKVNQAFQVELPLRIIFTNPIFADMVEYIENAETSMYKAIPVIVRKDYYPASSVQRRLYAIQQIESESTTYNLPYMMTITGELDRDRFAHALQELVNRHDSLRTSFEIQHGELYQHVHTELNFVLAYRVIKEVELAPVVADFVQSFDLRKAPLLRAELVEYGKNQYVFMYDMHHIISDGTSCGIFVQELLQLYAGEELLPLRIQYKDYAAWQAEFIQSKAYAKQEEYWLQAFAGEISVLNLPTDHARPLVKSFSGESVKFQITQELTDSLNTLASANGATLFMVLLAAYSTLLAHYSGQENLVIGTGLAGRSHAELENLVGMFVNTLPMQQQPKLEKHFVEFLAEVKENSLKVYENQDYQFETLVEKLGVTRDMSRNPLFDVVFVLQNFDFAQTKVDGVEFAPYEFKKTTAKFDLTLHAYETVKGLRFELEYSTELFNLATIERMVEHYVNILQAIVVDSGVTLGEIPLLGVKERQRLLVDFNATTTEFPRFQTLVELFEEQVVKTPEQVAVAFNGQTLTYHELNRRVNQLARVLKIKGVQREQIVGIMVERSFNMIAGLLAILKAGGAYLPIDPGYPETRIEFMLSDSETQLLLTQHKYIKRVSKFAGERIDLSDEILFTGEATNLEHISRADDLAYVIYTSGTTGKPKGSMTMHYNVSRVVKETNYISIMPEDKILQLSNYAFDGSTFDIFGALLNGATLVIPDKDIILEPMQLAEFIRVNGITIFFVTTALFNTLVEMNLECFAGVRKVLFGGERVSVQHVRKALTYLGSERIIHVYGPTESTVFATYYPVQSIPTDAETIPIGSGLANTELYILDQANRLLPIGVVGELCISGAGLARGYLKRPELTAAKFVSNPFKSGEKMYRTGDLVRWLADGNIEFIGRIDHQVKIRGFRIELGEIENELLKHPAIQKVTVIDRQDTSGNKYLCAYMVASEELSVDSLRKFLSTELPEYMIPSYFVRLKELPLNANGKIDRLALPEPDGSVNTGTEYVAPTSPLEEKLTEIWQEILGLSQIGVNDNFFALGGHSLKATFLVARIHQECNVEIPLREFFKHPSIKELADYLAQAKTSVIYTALPAVLNAEYYPVSSAQKRLLVLNELDATSLTYNVPFIWILEGTLQRDRFESAFKALIARHESLRTSFKTVNGEHVQIVHSDVDFVVDYIEIDDESNLESQIKKFVQPFNLSHAPLMRVGLVKYSDKHLFMLDMHHIITDGVSLDVMLKEFVQLYNGEQLPSLRIQYKDFAVWQNQFLQSAEVQAQESYWLKEFAGEIPQLNLPTDYPRPSVKSFQGAVINLEVAENLQRRLNELALKEEVTFYMILLAVYNMLLSKYSGQEDIIIGTPMAGRPHADVQKIVGMFVNTLAIRNYPVGNKRFCDFLAEVKETVLNVTENQDYQFEMLVEKLGIPRDMSRNPLFDVMLNLENANDDFAIDTCDFKLIPYPYDIKIAKFDLLLFIYEKAEGLHFELQYSTDLFEENTVERFLNHFLNLLYAVTEKPEARLAEISMLSLEERDELLITFNDTVVEYPKGKTIHQLFEERVVLSPLRIAVEYEGQTLTYQELNARANRLARVLRRNGVGQETVVGLMLERSLEMIVSLLAILKAGGAYLPIDPEYPKERVLYMLKDANAKVLLTKNQYIREMSYTTLENFEANEIELVLTNPRSHIVEFDQLPIPDRSYIDLSKYRDHIGMASVNRSISLQTTRGCPYLCLYCHKVWSKNHVFRSAENIYHEIEYYYRRGVTNFAIIDDCFNLDRENSSRVFKMIIQNGLKLKIFFPNGLRGDLLTPDYIDLMVEAGTVNINLSLETASPRLQKLVKKYLNLDKFKMVMEYIATKHPHVILELATMHGFPTETEEEAMQTLNFIKYIKWIHFPYIHILKVFPNTEIEELALANGVSKEDIMRSVNRAYHELPETLPFPKSFTRQYQAEFLNEYFLSKERLKQVLPVQMRILSDEALIEKYNAYLPVEVKSLQDVLDFAGITDLDLSVLRKVQDEETEMRVDKCVKHTGDLASIFDMPAQPRPQAKPGAKKLLFIDLSQHFSDANMLYKVSEQPLGLIYLMTYLKEQFAEKIDGRIYKSGVDFDSFAELKAIVDEYKPDMVGIRTLTFYKEFFHQTVAALRQWGVTCPIITGGPYATSEYNTLLKDKNVDLAVLGEGEYTLAELVGEMFKNDFTLPNATVLNEIRGIAFARKRGIDQSCTIMPLEEIEQSLEAEEESNLELEHTDANLAYVMYTSGTTGKPKGIMVEHQQVNNCINWMQYEFKLDEKAVVVQRTNLTFDPSVWEIFWPLYLGGKVRLLSTDQGKNAEYLIDLLSKNEELTMMYTPASLLTGMTYLLNAQDIPRKLRLPWFLIGAEPISMETVKNFYQYFEGKVVNTYGPTECTINNTYYYLEADDLRTTVPIGYPVANNQIYILSKTLELMPIGLPGEICIAGVSVARGYINNPERTADVFIDNPFGLGKLYKTGDIGRWLADGSIEINGRVDDQVKVRGYRIELGEIENALLKHDEIRECVVVVKDTKKSQDELQVCKKCGITTAYPDIHINDEGLCQICENLSHYKQVTNEYFRDLDDLDQMIREANKDKTSEYDCLILYAGGRGSAFALYQLVERGYKVLAATYDNGYLAGSDLKRIKAITDSLGVDHVVFTHPNTEQILKASLQVAQTVCQGCFLTSSSLAHEFAYKNGIKVVIGATLSRGQIIENKLYKLIRQGMTDVSSLEEELKNLQRVTYSMSEEITQHIAIETMKDGTIYDMVKSIDFYRYCDISNEEMINYLNSKDSYWQQRKNYAIYSTNCPIKQIGDFCHMQEKNYHYYGSATSWERRLGHITLENVKEDLQCKVTAESFANFARLIDYKRENQNRLDTKFLCAYLVSDEELPVADLRDFLNRDLPDYMIPSYFITLEKLPLTNNGKIDKKALPEPSGNISLSEYVAPTNEVEAKLASIWGEILGLQQVGINDNFFELGGDSIKAIQILAKTNQAGLNITVKDVFVHKTISKLLQNVDYSKTKEISSQDEVVGNVLLTPIQQWFFEQHLTHLHYWNQREIFTLRSDVNLELLEKAFNKLIEHHDALRMTYHFDGESVEQYNRSVADVQFRLEKIDLSAEETGVQATRLRVLCEQIQDKLNLSADLLIKAVVFDLGMSGKRLFIPIHHLVIDGISWRIILEDLENLYNSELREKLPLKSTSFKEWSKRLYEYAQVEELDLSYWLKIDPVQMKFLAEVTDNYWSDHREVQMRLTQEETEVLLTQVNWAYNTEINDTLLSALSLALGKGFGLEKILINLEGHGREEIISDLDLSRTVGWFTSAYPVYFERQADLAEMIKHVKESLRRVPEKGITFGIGRYIQNVLELQALQPQISFNYLGQYSSTVERGLDKLITNCHENAGRSLHSGNEHAFIIDINAKVQDGEFIAVISYNCKYFTDTKMQIFADLFRENLVELIAHCTNKFDQTLTVSDYAADELDQDDFETIAGLYDIS